MRHPIRPILLLASLATLAAPSATAQEGAGAWAPWLGCWVPEGSPAGAPLTCVVPGGGPGAVDLLTVTGGAISRRTSIVADGTQRPVDAAGCRGWESARFSLDADRVYLSADVTCDGRPAQVTSGVLSITSTGEWLDVQGVRVGAQENLRVSRLTPATDLTGVPEEVRTALAAVGGPAAGSRIIAGALPVLADVRDVAEAVAPATAEAWLVATHRDAAARFSPTARDLVALADAGIPARVIDVVVALGYPESFQVAVSATGEGSVARAARPAADRLALGGGAPAYDRSPWFYGGYGWFMPNCAFAFGPGSIYFDARRYNACSPMGYLPLYGPSWAFGGWGSWPGWTFGSPITVVVRPGKPTDGGGGGTPEPTRRGRVVRGGGYTQEGGTPTGEPAKPRTETATRAGGMGAGSDGGARSGGSPTGGAPTGAGPTGTSTGSTERTAKPRKP